MAVAGSEVRVAGSGHVYLAPVGTAMPTDTAALPADWVDLGYVTEDGVAFNFDRETEDLNSWQGDKVRVLTMREPKSIEFALMQTNVDVVTAALGGGEVTADSGNTTFTYTPPAEGTNTPHALVVEFDDGTLVYRYNFPKVQLDGGVQFTLTRSGAVTYPLNFGVLDPDAGVAPFTIITNDPAMDPGAPA